MQLINENLLSDDTVLTQAKILAIAKKCSSPNVEWAETRVDAQLELEKSLKNVVKDLTNFQVILPLLQAALLSGKYGAAYLYSEVDNELVGLSFLMEEEVEKEFAPKFQACMVGCLLSQPRSALRE